MNFRDAFLYLFTFGAGAAICVVCVVGVMVWFAGGKNKPPRRQ
jgi:hypothetical protein